MTNASERIYGDLKTNLPHLIEGHYEPLAGTPETEEFAQINARLNDNPTGEEVHTAIMRALDESGVGIDAIVSATVDETRCSLGLMMGDAEGTAALNISYNTGMPLRITVLKTVPRHE